MTSQIIAHRIINGQRIPFDQTSDQRIERAGLHNYVSDNFLGFAEVSDHLNSLTYRHMEDKVPFTEEVLEACALGYILVADIGLSLLDMLGKANLSPQKRWYKNEEFAKRTDQPCWRLISLKPAKDSVDKTWSEQQSLIPDTHEVPSIRQVVYMTILQHMTIEKSEIDFGLDKWLFDRVDVRTCDVDSDGNHLDVGFSIYGRGGPSISCSNGKYGHLGLGVSIARKPDLS
jgi:hypothetical protein